MAAPKTTIWPLDPHTAAKHLILRRYLDAWLPILSHGGFPDIAHVDAFAGPGRYSNGEAGSPIIALKAMLGHQTPIQARCRFHFVELNADRADTLEQAIAEVLSEYGNPRNVTATVHRSKFELAYNAIRDDLSRQKNIPTFAFLDPFGWTGLPFSVVQDLVQRPSGEVLINFMFEEINRFLGHPDQEANFDALFGTPAWRQCISLSGAARNQCLRDLYARQLTVSARAKYVRYFEMRNARDATDYYLFFATNRLQGLKKMKEAMWKVDEAGQFTFSDATDHSQLVMFNAPQFDILRKQILAEFSGRKTTVEDIGEFVVAHTAFRETHFKVQVLKPLEALNPPGLTVTGAKLGRKRGTFPAGTTIQFARSHPGS